MSEVPFLQSSLRELLTHECDEDCGDECPVKELRGRIGFEKLYDHVSLEAKRAGYDHTRATGIITDIRKAQEDLENAKRLVEEAQAKADKASGQAKRLQTETVSVLGVFSAIILAFNASVTFSTSSIAAVDATPPFNVAFIVAIVGLTLFNCLYAAFALVYRIIRPENSPEKLLAPTKVAGIELCAVSCSLFLGTLTYFYDRAGGRCECLALGTAVLALLIGVCLIIRSEKNRTGSAGNPE